MHAAEHVPAIRRASRVGWSDDDRLGIDNYRAVVLQTVPD